MKRRTFPDPAFQRDQRLIASLKRIRRALAAWDTWDALGAEERATHEPPDTLSRQQLQELEQMLREELHRVDLLPEQRN